MSPNKFISCLLLPVLILLPCITAQSQTGALMPYAFSTYLNSNGTAPAANGFLCSYSAGTTTPANTWQDPTLTTLNHNPIQLNSAGQTVAWGGSTGLSIFLNTSLTYKFSEYASGTGNTCNGSSVGPLIRTIDNISASGGGGGGGGISGSGTMGFLSKFTGSTAIGNSAVSEGSFGSVSGLIVNERTLISGVATDATTGSLFVLGGIDTLNNSSNANGTLLYSLVDGTYLASIVTGTAILGPIHLDPGQLPGVRITVDPFLQIDGSDSSGVLCTSGTVALRNNAGVLEKCENGGAWATVASGGGSVSGSGTTNRITKFTGSTAIGNANPVDTGSLFTISEPLVVNAASTDAATYAIASIGDIYAVSATTNAVAARLHAQAGAAIVSSEFTGGGSFQPLFLTTGGHYTNPVLQLTVSPFLELDQPYGGGTLCSVGSAALRNNSGTLEFCNNGVSWAPIGSGGTISGSGTTNFVPLYTGSTAIGNSIIASASSLGTNLGAGYYMNGKVLVGGTTADMLGSSFNVLGGIGITNNAANARGILISTSGISTTVSGTNSTYNNFSIVQTGAGVVVIQANTNGFACINTSLGLRFVNVSAPGGSFYDAGAC